MAGGKKTNAYITSNELNLCESVFSAHHRYDQEVVLVFTKKQVQDMAERDLRQRVLVPLLRAMKYQDVHEYHGTTEFGKDIIGWDADKLGNRENLALVVKATTVSGQSKASADIENQVRQCFSKPYIDMLTGTEETIDRCWVVSNQPISHAAIDLIKSGIGHAVYAENVSFIDIDKLWELIEKYMPLQASLQKLEDVRHDFESLDTHYRVETRISGDGIQHTLAEKFPGAAQEKPLAFQMAFEFPNTEDGKAQVEALEKFRDTGAPVRIPGIYVKSLEYPDFLKQIYPAMTPDGFLQFGPLPHPKPLLLNCDIVSDDGDRFVVDYIHLTCIQAGQKEITLTNENQPIPFKMQLVIHFDGNRSSFHMSTELDDSCNVHQELLHAQLLRCISKPHTMCFTNLETGIVVASGRNEVGVGETPHEEFIEVLAVLDALQIKSRKLVYFPNRALTEEECKVINTLHILLHTGKLSITWSGTAGSVNITNENRENIVQELGQLAEEGGFAYPQEETLSLFGEVYPLGPVKPLSLPIMLKNWPEIKALSDTGYCGEIKLEFVPRDDGSFTKEYVQWLPEQNDLPTESFAPDGNALT